MSGCDNEIHELHASLIHKARDIQFQLVYQNGVDPAVITDIGKKNVQEALESYFSKVGIPVKNVQPIGLRNNVNLTYSTPDEFIPGSLEVFLSGFKLNGDPTDPDRDYSELVTNNGFILHIDPMKSHRLNSPPKQFESLATNYSKRITFNTLGGT